MSGPDLSEEKLHNLERHVQHGLARLTNEAGSECVSKEELLTIIAAARRSLAPPPPPVERGELHQRQMQGCCIDCGRKYGNEHGFPDLLVPNDVWVKISPTGHEGGLLCPSCMCRRAFDAGLENIPARFVSGPFAPPPSMAAETGVEASIRLRRSLAPWQKIDSAPKDGTAILISDGKQLAIASYRTGRVWSEVWRWEARCRSGDETPATYFRNPTHWCPLPPPPSMAAETGKEGVVPVAEPTVAGRKSEPSGNPMQNGLEPQAAQSEERKEDGRGRHNQNRRNERDKDTDVCLDRPSVAPPPQEGGETCFWCGGNAAENAKGHEGPHSTWCPHFREDQRGGNLPVADAGDLVDRLLRWERLLGYKPPLALLQDLREAAAMLQAQAEEIERWKLNWNKADNECIALTERLEQLRAERDDLRQRVYMLETITPTERPLVEAISQLRADTKEDT